MQKSLILIQEEQVCSKNKWQFLRPCVISAAYSLLQLLEELNQSEIQVIGKWRKTRPNIVQSAECLLQGKYTMRHVKSLKEPFWKKNEYFGKRTRIHAEFD